MTKLVIAYRDNKLFAKYVPQIALLLQDEGCEVQTIVFPAETQSKDIRAALRSSVVLTTDLILPDWTCSILLPFCVWDKPERSLRGDENSNDFMTLDAYLCWTTKEVVRGKKLEEWGIGSEDATKGVLKQIVADALQHGAPNPQKIVIAQADLFDHLHLNYDRTKRTSDPLSTDSVVGWFQELFPNATIQLVSEASAPEPNSWLVADRHHVQENTLRHWRSRNPSMGLVFRLPLETAAQDLANLGLLSLDEAQFDTILRKYLQEHIREAVARISGAG
jgi:hypothetical protein